MISFVHSNFFARNFKVSPLDFSKEEGPALDIPRQAHTLVDSRSTKYHLDSKPHGSVPVLGSKL